MKHFHRGRALRAALHRAVLALVAAMAAPAVSAQASPAGASSVTIFGTLDVNATFTRAGGESARAMEQGGNLVPSRLGFRGTEDLGGGLAAGFWIESALLPDTGEVQGAMWNRRSTLSLSSVQWGELRVGRDYAPTFWNFSSFAPFGTVGVAGSSNLAEGWPFGLGGARTLARASNSVGYFLPKNLGGVYGQVMFAASEGNDGTRYRGLRLGYASGPLDVALAYGETPAGGQTYREAGLGGAYDFGPLKLMGYHFDHRAGDDRQTNTLLGVAAPVGQGTVRVSVNRADRSAPGLDGNDALLLGVGYAHALSRRTALYATYALIRNSGQASYVTADSSPAASPGGTASGLQLGLSHNF